MLLVGLPIGVAIGIVLGLVGAGGAVLATPLLVLLGNFPFVLASTGALFVVLFASTTSVLLRGAVILNLKTAFQAVILGAIGSVPGAWLATQISEFVALVILASVLLLAAVATWSSERRAQLRNQRIVPLLKVALFVFTGFLTGLAGVGGGYILIPGLLMLTGLTFNSVVSLALLIVIGNSLVSLATRFSNGVTFSSEQISIIALVVTATVLGSIIGSKLSLKLDQKIVQRCFASLAAALALAVTWEALQVATFLE